MEILSIQNYLVYSKSYVSQRFHCIYRYITSTVHTHLLGVLSNDYVCHSPYFRFLLCNQSLLSVVTRPPPYRQHSSASQSSGGQLQGVELAAGEEQPHPQGGGVQGGASASSQGGVETSDGERHKPSKATTPEDEVARLTIEVHVYHCHR